MPQGNYNFGADYIMNSDKTPVDQDVPKKQTKPTVEASLFAMADQKDY
jgi:hypothetical protein